MPRSKSYTCCQLCDSNAGPGRKYDRVPEAVAVIANVRVCRTHLETIIAIAAENGVRVDEHQWRAA